MSKNAADNLNLQANIFGHYLVREPIAESIRLSYVQAINSKLFKIDRRQQKFLDFVQKHPRSIGLVDAGLALYKPHSEVRRRLYLMLSILEASPEYHEKFLPQARKPFYVFFIAYSGLRAIFKAMLGVALVRLI